MRSLLRTLAVSLLFLGACAQEQNRPTEEVSGKSTPVADGDIPVGPDVAPTLVNATNPTCGDIDPTWIELKFDNPADGTISDGTATITIDMLSGSSLNFESDLPIYAVLMKAGSEAHNLYNYTIAGGPGPQLADDGLVTADGKDLSHVSFCYKLELGVTKTANTSYTRKFDWDIDKVGDQTALTLSPGQSFLVNYSITVDQLGYTDSDFAVSGEIKVYNPAPFPVDVISVNDVISGGINATVSCPGTFPVTLGPKETLTCTYSSPLPDATSRLNTAAATSGTEKVGDGTGTAAVNFGDPSTVLDECVDVTDDNATPSDPSDDTSWLGICEDKVLAFSRTIGPYYSPDGCGEHTVTNTASFVSSDGGDSGSDDHTVIVTVPCEKGCSLTQGYWKTHSKEGPAPYDDTWALLGPLEEDTPLFGSGLTWYNAFWKPVGGDPWLILAHQYMAAYLNVLNGADSSSISDALTQAEALLSGSSPGSVSKTQKSAFIGLAGKLASYNEGEIGPGHCSE